MVARRAFVLKGCSLLALGAGGLPAAAEVLPLGTARPFDFTDLVARARAQAKTAFRSAAQAPAAVLDAIDYDAHWRIRFREEAAPLLPPDSTPVQLFHLGRYARDPVAIHLVEDGWARELAYTPEAFAMPAASPAKALPADAGYAGFRLMRPDHGPDWLVFLGASYFRADGPDRQYGLSARGLAIDTGLDRPEEFPRFTAFWIGGGERVGETAVVHALLDGPSVTGAYRIGCAHLDDGGQRLSVDTRLFLRRPVERLGIAPLTSMFWYGEGNRATALDWRPEVHDSDGLAIWTGAGERIWRPLRNPRRVTTSSFFDHGPRGFGLSQRDRAFAHYQDDGVFYDRRPSAWVTPEDDWGPGAVQLVEIPTHDETFDNVVAYWLPAELPPVGEELALAYTVDWLATDPPPDLARVTATRIGQGGIPGQPVPPGVLKYVIDFAGGPLADLSADARVAPAIEASGGRIVRPSAHRLVGQDVWRVIFDLDGAATAPIDLRVHLRHGEAALSETWIGLAEAEALPVR